jgi:hypothetical protein
MHSDTESKVESGMRLVARLPDIMPQQADARMKPIYDDIQQVLRVPFVNLIFRTLANYPDYLESAWQALRPLASSREFEQFADELRSHALLPNLPESPDLREKEVSDREKLRSFNDTIHYVLPKLLLTVSAFAKSANEQKEDQPVSPVRMSLSPAPAGIAEGTGKVEMVDPEKANERIQRLFEEIKQRHGHPLVSSYYRGLANWPDMLESVWNKIAPYVGSADYEARKKELIHSASMHLHDWPPLPVKIDPAHSADIDAILSAFRQKFIPEMLLDAVLIKSALDGRQAAGISRFSMEP